MSPIEFHRPFQFDSEAVLAGLDWTPRVAITRERKSDGGEFCVCWIGTFWVMVTDSGGFQGQGDGVAVGFTPDGKIWTNDEWDLGLSNFGVGDDEPDEVTLGAIPLKDWVGFAPFIAAVATMLLEPLTRAIQEGRRSTSELTELIGAADDLSPGVQFILDMAVRSLWVALLDELLTEQNHPGI